MPTATGKADCVDSAACGLQSESNPSHVFLLPNSFDQNRPTPILEQTEAQIQKVALATDLKNAPIQIPGQTRQNPANPRIS